LFFLLFGARVRRRTASLGEFGGGLQVGDGITHEIADRRIEFCGSLVIAVGFALTYGLFPGRALRSRDPERVKATQLGVESTFRPTPVAVYLGEPGVESDDPYFGGAGPRRSGCTLVGACMVECNNNAKNTLDKNYLYQSYDNSLRLVRKREGEPLPPRRGRPDTQITTTLRPRGAVYHCLTNTQSLSSHRPMRRR